MTTTNTAGRGLAIAAGVVFATGALAVLFQDVIVDGAPIALKHYLTLVIVAGTMMAGHLADHARRHKHWAASLGFSLIFLAGTGLVVYSSVGRQGEKLMTAAGEHDKTVTERNELERQLTDERATRQAKRDAADRECASGDGSHCKGARATVAFYETSVAGLEARLELIKPAKVVDPEAEQLANTIAAMGGNREQARALATLLAPFLKTLFLEFGTIVSLGFAFSPKRQPRKLSAKAETALVGVSDDELAGLRQAFDRDECPVLQGNLGNSGKRRLLPKPDKPGNGGGGCGIYSKTEAEADLVTRLALGETVASQDDLANRWGVNKGTVSKWLKEWEQRQLIPARQQIGRCKRVKATA